MKTASIAFAIIACFIWPTLLSAQSSQLCETFWYERNKVFADKGLCYTSRMGRSLFATYPCHTHRARDIRLLPKEIEIVQDIVRLENQNRCNIPLYNNAPYSLQQRAITERGTETNASSNTAELDQNTSSARQKIAATPLQKGDRAVVCTPNGDSLHLRRTPKEGSGVLANLINGFQTVISEPSLEEKTGWVYLKAETPGGTQFEGYAKSHLLAHECSVPHSSKISNILSNHFYFPHQSKYQIYKEKELGEIPEGDGSTTETTKQANRALNEFFWTRPDCGPPPTFLFTKENLRFFEEQIKIYKSCLNLQSKHDPKDVRSFILKIGADVKIQWGEENILFPWDCATCQSHLRLIKKQEDDRKKRRSELLAESKLIEETIKAWKVK